MSSSALALLLATSTGEEKPGERPENRGGIPEQESILNVVD